MPAARIVSFLPSATEMACALGLEDAVLGVSHECDFPPAMRDKPVVVRAVLPVETMTQAEIDAAVSARMRDGQSLYAVDEDRVRALEPDLILTQDLCQVCAPSGNEVVQLLKALPKKPRVLYLTPKSLDGIFANIHELGDATGRNTEAAEVVARCKARLERLAAATAELPRPRVFCMEWTDPVYCCGHWVPEMVRIAGGRDELGREGTDSVRIAWDDVLRYAPEVLIVMPCGYGLAKSAELAATLAERPGFRDLPAVRAGRVYAADANSYFARPGPRVVEGTELLAHLIHPERFDWHGGNAYRRIAS
jgi:iron complex transport system substrate-binding protein